MLFCLLSDLHCEGGQQPCVIGGKCAFGAIQYCGDDVYTAIAQKSNPLCPLKEIK